MRSFRDRLRHAISFEILGLLIITPIAALTMDEDLAHIGVVTAGSATLAMVWTYIYNWGFDHALERLQSGDLCLILIDQVEEALAHIGRRVAESSAG